MSNNKNNLVMSTWVDEFTRFIALQSLNLLSTGALDRGIKDKEVKAAYTKFIQHYVEQIVLASLLEHENEAGLTREQIYEKTYRNFSLLRNDIQNEIAQAFENAMKRCTGRDLEYICNIYEATTYDRTKVSS